MNPIELAAITGLITALVGAVIAMRKFKPERDSLVVTQAQGAATILNDLVRTLYAEIDRLRAEIDRLKEELERCRGERKK